MFNREVWRIESGTYVRGTPEKLNLLGDLRGAELERAERLLDAGELELHGNYCWGSGQSSV